MLAVGNSWSTTYSQTLTNGWSVGVTGSVGQKDVGSISVTAGYSGSVSNSESTQQSAMQTTTTTSGTTSSISLDMPCPATIPNDTMCTWTYNSFSVTAWNSVAWDIPATFTLLGGQQITTVLGGGSTSGSTAFNKALNLKV